LIATLAARTLISKPTWAKCFKSHRSGFNFHSIALAKLNWLYLRTPPTLSTPFPVPCKHICPAISITFLHFNQIAFRFGLWPLAIAHPRQPKKIVCFWTEDILNSSCGKLKIYYQRFGKKLGDNGWYNLKMHVCDWCFQGGISGGPLLGSFSLFLIVKQLIFECKPIKLSFIKRKINTKQSCFICQCILVFISMAVTIYHRYENSSRSQHIS